MDTQVLINDLLKTKKSFIEQTYNHPINKDFRDCKDCSYKTSALFKLYRLEKIDIDFIHKGILPVNCVPEDLYINSIKVFYKINSGAKTLYDFICTMYSLDKYSGPFFNIENDCLVISNSYVLFNSHNIEKLDPKEVVDKFIDGGEEKIKQIVEEINDSIDGMNKQLLDYSNLIASN